MYFKQRKGFTLFRFLRYKNSKSHFYPGMTGGIKVKRGFSFWIPGNQKLAGSFLPRNDRWNSRKQGFTLIELLVVIAIIALLSSVVMASLSTARMKARDTKRIADLNQIKIALELYFDANGYYPGTYKTDATYCPTPPCWDLGFYNISTNATNWALFAADLSPYISKLPVDPINISTGNPKDGSSHIYSYGQVGRNGLNPSSGKATIPNTYDLFATLEDPENRNTCKYNDYYWGLGSGGTPLYWCTSGKPGFADGYYQMYVLHP